MVLTNVHNEIRVVVAVLPQLLRAELGQGGFHPIISLNINTPSAA